MWPPSLDVSCPNYISSGDTSPSKLWNARKHRSSFGISVAPEESPPYGRFPMPRPTRLTPRGGALRAPPQSAEPEAVRRLRRGASNPSGSPAPHGIGSPRGCLPATCRSVFGVPSRVPPLRLLLRQHSTRTRPAARRCGSLPAIRRGAGPHPRPRAGGPCPRPRDAGPSPQPCAACLFSAHILPVLPAPRHMCVVWAESTGGVQQLIPH